LLDFDCADVTADIVSIWSRQATLVNGQFVSEWIRAARRIAGVDRGAAGLWQEGLGRPTVVLQRSEFRIQIRPVRAGANETALPKESDQVITGRE